MYFIVCLEFFRRFARAAGALAAPTAARSFPRYHHWHRDTTECESMQIRWAAHEYCRAMRMQMPFSFASIRMRVLSVGRMWSTENVFITRAPPRESLTRNPFILSSAVSTQK